MATLSQGLWVKQYISTAAQERSAQSLIIDWFKEYGDKVVCIPCEDIMNPHWADDCNSAAVRANVLHSLGYLNSAQDYWTNDYTFKINQDGVNFFQKAIGL